MRGTQGAEADSRRAGGITLYFISGKEGETPGRNKAGEIYAFPTRKRK